ncbi:MAG: hypothetical protein ACHQET_10480 [Chitinophagales bacterium]
MNRVFEFFNKIVGLMVFFIAIAMIFLLIHRGHHYMGWHHRHFRGHQWTKDSLYKEYKDSVNRK